MKGWPECNCDICRACCERRVCWPTPEEARQMIEAGLGHRLMADYWEGGHFASNGDIDILCPAIVEYEGRRAPSWPYGQCTFYSEAGCEIHDSGFKPIEGRLTQPCVKEMPDLHEEVAMMWNNPGAQELVREWFRR